MEEDLLPEMLEAFPMYDQAPGGYEDVNMGVIAKVPCPGVEN